MTTHAAVQGPPLALGRVSCGAIALSFCLAQVVWIGLLSNGPFLDEGVNVVAGSRLTNGFRDDFSWLGGSVWLFPLLAGIAHAAGGLAATRIVATIFFSASIWLAGLSVQRRYGRTPALVSTLFLSTNGILFSVAHLAVYDCVAFFGTTLALFCSDRGGQTSSRSWWLGAAAAMVLAVLAKYSVALMMPLVVLLFAVDGTLKMRQLVLLTLLPAAASIAYMLLVYGTVLPAGVLSGARDAGAAFDDATLAMRCLYACGAPLVVFLACLAFGDTTGFTRGRLWVATLGLLLWPLLHLTTRRYVSLEKHAVYGLLFVAPIVGVCVARWIANRRWVYWFAAPLLTWSAVQTTWQDHSWANIRPLADFLVPMLRSDDEVVADPGWDLALYAIAEGPLASPWAIVDRTRRHNGASPCDADWIIAPGRGAFGAEDPLVGQALACGHELVRRFPAPFVAITSDFVAHMDWELLVFQHRSEESRCEVSR